MRPKRSAPFTISADAAWMLKRLRPLAAAKVMAWITTEVARPTSYTKTLTLHSSEIAHPRVGGVNLAISKRHLSINVAYFERHTPPSPRLITQPVSQAQLRSYYVRGTLNILQVSALAHPIRIQGKPVSGLYDHPMFDQCIIVDNQRVSSNDTFIFVKITDPRPTIPWRASLIGVKPYSPKEIASILARIGAVDPIAANHLLGLERQAAIEIMDQLTDGFITPKVAFTDVASGQRGILTGCTNQSIRAKIALAPNLAWTASGIFVTSLPETMIQALTTREAGRPACEVIDHPALAGYHIKAVKRSRTPAKVCLTLAAHAGVFQDRWQNSAAA